MKLSIYPFLLLHCALNVHAEQYYGRNGDGYDYSPPNPISENTFVEQNYEQNYDTTSERYYDTTSESYDNASPAPTMDYSLQEGDIQHALELSPPTSVELNFAHQELGFEQPSHHQGGVERLKLHFISDNAIPIPCTDSKDLHTIVLERAANRPPGRRLVPYTETIVDESYFVPEAQTEYDLEVL